MEMTLDESIENLTASLQSSDSSVRASAVIALGNTGRLEAVRPLLTALRDDNHTVRLFVVRSLRSITRQNPDVGEIIADVMIQLLSSPDERIRRTAMFTLGDIRHEPAIEPLIEMFREANGSFALDIFYVLVEIGGLEVLPRAIPLFKNKSERVQRSLSLALEKIGYDVSDITGS